MVEVSVAVELEHIVWVKRFHKDEMLCACLSLGHRRTGCE